jgi:hypothetical protein
MYGGGALIEEGPLDQLLWNDAYLGSTPWLGRTGLIVVATIFALGAVSTVASPAGQAHA